MIAADAENVSHLLEDDHSPFPQRFLQHFEDSVGHCLRQPVMFKVLQLSWVEDSSFKKSPRVRSDDRGGQRPRPPVQLPKKSCKKALVVFAVWLSPHLAETSNPVHSVPAEQRVESNRFYNFSQKLSLQRKVVPQFVFETLHTKHQSLTNVQDYHAVHVGFQHSMFYCFD
jgi:hypothetical protein